MLLNDDMLVEYDLIEHLTVGDINYIITTVVDTWLGVANYERLNAAIGVLESAKLELYRRRVAHYEEAKCLLNGDVYNV